MSRRERMAAATCAVVVVLLLTGCATSQGGSAPTTENTSDLMASAVESPTPVATASPTATPSPVAIASVVDAMLAAWNSGDGSAATALYARISQVRFVIDSGPGSDVYGWPGDISAGVAEQATRGLVMTRTGAVVCEGAFCAFPMTWATQDHAGDAVTLLQRDASGSIVSQYVIGTSASAPTLQAATARDAVVAEVDGLLGGFDAHDLARALASFTDDAEWRYTYVRSGNAFGWRGEFVGRAQIGAFFAEAWQTVKKERDGEVIAQGPLLLCPIKLTVSGSAGVEFWVLELTAGNHIRSVWAVGG